MQPNFWTNTKEWIEKTTPMPDVQDVYKEFYTNEVFKFTHPKGDPPEWVDWVKPPQFGTDHKFDKSYVSTIKNGSIWMHPRGEGIVFVLTPDHKCLHDMVFHQYWRFFKKIAVKRIPPDTTFYQGTLGVLAWAGHTNYWHWLHDTLGRYHLLQLSGFNIDKYVLPPLTLPFQRETVEMLGIPKEKIVELSPGMHLKAENLILPSVPFNTGTAVKWTVEFLRKTFLKPKSYKSAIEYFREVLFKSHAKSGDFERIYISREDASWRKVMNEEEVMHVLSKRGFRKIVLSSLTVQEQINIFSSSKVIIGSNGAGLANIMFCQPGTKVIQLFTSTSDEFMKIGQYLDLDFYFLKCAIALPRSKKHEVMNNLIVDVNKLSSVLENQGIN